MSQVALANELTAGDLDVALILHGFTGRATAMTPLTDRLVRLRRILAVDLIGHGDSPAPVEIGHYTLEASIQQLAAIMADRGLPSADVVGYSMGGRLGLCLAVARPELVRSLVTIGATAGLTDPVQRQARQRADRALAADIEARGLEWFVDDWAARPIFASQMRLGPAALAAMRQQRLTATVTGLANSLRGMGTGAMEPIHAQLARLDVPVLVLAGAEDGKFSTIGTKLAEQLPRGCFASVPEAGHAAHVENPDGVVAAIERFWSKR